MSHPDDLCHNRIGTKETEKLIRENERLKAALRAVESYCSNAVFGGWRSDILALVRNAWRTT